jgi:hypothetical protein
VWILMAVLGLRRGARSDELRRGSCKRIFFVHEGSQSFEILYIRKYPASLCSPIMCVCFRALVPSFLFEVRLSSLCVFVSGH